MLTLLYGGEGNTDNFVNIEREIIWFFGVRDLMHVLMFLMRNSGDPSSSHCKISGSVKESDKHNLNMYVARKSDKAIVVKKRANKVIVEKTAEFVERRALTKRNSDTASVTRTQRLG
jgi:hypothetical protein